MREFFYGLGDVIYWVFEHTLEPLGNIPNWSFIILGFIGLFVWLKMQKDFNDKAKATGELK